MTIIIGDTYKAFTPTLRTVTVRKMITKHLYTVSLGFDSNGKDILTMVHIHDFLPKD